MSMKVILGGTVHLSSLFSVACPTFFICMVVETKGLCGACLTAQDRPSLSRRPWLRCAGSRKPKKASLKWRLLCSWSALCICMYSLNIIHTHIDIACYPWNILSLHWTPWHCFRRHAFFCFYMFFFVSNIWYPSSVVLFFFLHQNIEDNTTTKKKGETACIHSDLFSKATNKCSQDQKKNRYCTARMGVFK